MPLAFPRPRPVPRPTVRPLALGGTALTGIAQWISDTTIADQRTAMVARHWTDSESSFKGFTDLTGFTTQTATSADDLVSKLDAQTASQKLIIECAWNGVSETSNRPLGASAASLTANGAVDWGYNRPVMSALVRPATGYTPEIRAIYGSSTGLTTGRLEMIGVHWLEFRDMTFRCQLRLTENGSFPGPGIVALTRCSFIGVLGQSAICPQSARLVHMDDCVIDGCEQGALITSNYFRAWNTIVKNHRDNDVFAARGYIYTEYTNWDVNIWIAGTILYNMTGVLSGNHCDFLQISTTNVEIHNGYRCLVEFNVAHLNNAGGIETQGCYGSDGATQGWFGEWCVHNNIFASQAQWALYLFDPSDNQGKTAYRNIVARAASAASTDQDPAMVVRGDRGGQPAGSGYLTVKENYYTQHATYEGLVANETFTGNVDLDFRVGATAGTTPQELLTGNGTWTTASGKLRYTKPENGLTDPYAARSAIVDFFKPIAGWRGASAGPVNPDTWPTDFETLDATVWP